MADDSSKVKPAGTQLHICEEGSSQEVDVSLTEDPGFPSRPEDEDMVLAQGETVTIPAQEHSTPSPTIDALSHWDPYHSNRAKAAAEEVVLGPTFHPFRRLPIELRLKIWNNARPGPRFIKLTQSQRDETVYSRAKIPALLHVNREARELALKWYRLSFPADGLGFVPRVYFDWERDGLLSGCQSSYLQVCGHRILSNEQKEVTKIAYIGHLQHTPFPHIHRLYPKVQEILLIEGRLDSKTSEVAEADFLVVETVFIWQYMYLFGREMGVVPLLVRRQTELSIHFPETPADSLKATSVKRVTFAEASTYDCFPQCLHCSY